MARPIPAIATSSNVVTTYEEMLSLKMLNELHLKNLDEIRSLTHKTKLLTFSGLIVPVILLLSLLWVTAKRVMSKREILRIENVHLPSVGNKDQDTSNVEVGI